MPVVVLMSVSRRVRVGFIKRVGCSASVVVRRSRCQLRLLPVIVVVELSLPVVVLMSVSPLSVLVSLSVSVFESVVVEA